MRTHPAAALALLATLASGSGCSRAQAFESFTLEEDDKLIAEAPGCNAECTPSGPGRRICTLRDLDCRAVCQPIPECKTQGVHVLKACAVIRSRP
jgi:hypothetical protein